MNQIILLGVGILLLALGAVLGYLARQSIARRKADTIEQTLEKKTAQTRQESEGILAGARAKAKEILQRTSFFLSRW